MTNLETIIAYLQQLAPLHLAESWDNVGLLLGDRRAEVKRVMTCLTITPESCQEAVESGVDLIVTHHPLPFQPLRQITTDDTTGELILQLLSAKVCVYSPHTAFDSAVQGINQSLAARLQLSEVTPIIPTHNIPADGVDAPVGAGRIGQLPQPIEFSQWVESIKQQLGLPGLKWVGQPSWIISRVAIACGSGRSFLEPARQARCDALVTGEVDFHTCLAARATAVGLVLLGHYSSERPAVEALARTIGANFPMLEVWPSRMESDPIHHV